MRDYLMFFERMIARCTSWEKQNILAARYDRLLRYDSRR